DARARVERVDHHLALDRARDLAAPVEQVGGSRRDAPLALADRARLRQEARVRAGVELALPLRSPLQERHPLRVQRAMEARHECPRLLGKDLLADDRTHAANCASSVEPFSASVSLSGDTACVTRSKYPAPTSRWWRVAVYPDSSSANSCSCSS